MDKIRKRQFEQLTFVTLEELEAEIGPDVEALFSDRKNAKGWPSGKEKIRVEQRLATQLVFMLEHEFTAPGEITVCVEEDEDFDCVLRHPSPIGESAFTRVQFKHLPPADWSDNVDVQKEITKLKKYGIDPDLAVVIWVNRDVRFVLGELDFSGLGIGQLWFLGFNSSGELTLRGERLALLKAGRALERVKGVNYIENKQLCFIAASCSTSSP